MPECKSPDHGCESGGDATDSHDPVKPGHGVTSFQKCGGVVGEQISG